MRKILGACVGLLIHCLEKKNFSREGIVSHLNGTETQCYSSWGISTAWTQRFDLFERYFLRGVGLINSIKWVQIQPSLEILRLPWGCMAALDHISFFCNTDGRCFVGYSKCYLENVIDVASSQVGCSSCLIDFNTEIMITYTHSSCRPVWQEGALLPPPRPPPSFPQIKFHDSTFA